MPLARGEGYVTHESNCLSGGQLFSVDLFATIVLRKYQEVLTEPLKLSSFYIRLKGLAVTNYVEFNRIYPAKEAFKTGRVC